MRQKKKIIVLSRPTVVSLSNQSFIKGQAQAKAARSISS